MDTTTPRTGDKVICIFADGCEERGEVVFQRNAPPMYTTPEAYSVRLDSRKDRPGYTGTMLSAANVRLAGGS